MVRIPHVRTDKESALNICTGEDVGEPRACTQTVEDVDTGHVGPAAHSCRQPFFFSPGTLRVSGSIFSKSGFPGRTNP